MEVLIIYNKNDIKSSDIKKKKSEKNYITLYLIGAEREVTAKIHERFLLPCPTFSDPENVTSIGWYGCSNDDCEHDWNKFLIAYVENMTDTIADNPNFELHTNHTLVIKKVLPVDDGKMFICIVKEKLVGRSMSTTILHIAKGNIYICYIMMMIEIIIM